MAIKQSCGRGRPGLWLHHGYASPLAGERATRLCEKRIAEQLRSRGDVLRSANNAG
jgi:hypothetical protein